MESTKHSQLSTFSFIIILSLLTTICYGQYNKAFYVGHSLSDQIPDMVKSLAEDHPSTDFDWVYQGVPGAPLRWQWQEKNRTDYPTNPPHYYTYFNEEAGLPVGDFDIMILTESVPRYMYILDETYQYADSFFQYANNYNPDIKVYVYEVWHCLKSGTPTQCDYDVDSNPWRQRIDDDLWMWESVVDTLNARYASSTPVCLIPAAQGLAQVYDSIYAGVMPGLSDINDIFSDDIHLNDIGKYFVACVHFASFFETSPVGLTNQLQVWWGGDFDPPSEELALKFQEIAWNTLKTYPRSCIENVTSINIADKNSPELLANVHPNPSHLDMTVEWQSAEDGYTTVEIYNIMGQKITSLINDFRIAGSYSIDFESTRHEKGLYFCNIKVGNQSVTRKIVIN